LETIHSIQNQSFHNWELIAIDDHSSDEGFAIMSKLSQIDDRISVFKNTEFGITPALSLALSQCRGTYITRMDADDLMPENRLELMCNHLKQCSESTIITGLVKYFSNQPISVGYQRYEKWLNQINIDGEQWPNIYRECVIASPNWMMRTDLLRSIGGFDGLNYPEDYDLVLRWYAHKLKIEVIPEVTLLWREHPNRTSRTSENYDQAHFFQLKMDAFIQIDWNGEPLTIWGDNVKSSLVIDFLKERNIEYSQMNLNEFQEIEKLKNNQLLVCVYPSENERMKLEKYLLSINRQIGKDWWYL
jgi:glycosyltransferase involved in cell wall biosynthesis